MAMTTDNDFHAEEAEFMAQCEIDHALHSATGDCELRADTSWPGSMAEYEADFNATRD